MAGLRKMMREDEVLEVIPVSRSTLLRMAKTGKFPRPTHISPNRRCWYEDEIIAWQNSVDEFQPNRGRGKGRPKRKALGDENLLAADHPV